MIKAVIFDLGGVLIDNPVPEMIRYCAQRLEVAPRDLARATRNFRAVLQEGLITEETFWEKVCQELEAKGPGPYSLWGEAFQRAYAERVEMFALLRVLRENGYLLGLLSNTETPSVRLLDTERYRVFNALIFSCVEGISKPQEGIYRIALDRLGVVPQEALFVDDQAENISGAEVLGINSILFSNLEKLTGELIRFGVRWEEQ